MSAKSDRPPLPAGSAEHPLRQSLNDELHARPYVAIQSPARVSHLALLATPGDRDHAAALCRHYDRQPPPEGVNYWYIDLGPCRMNWERHTEFSTYTFYCRDQFDEPFDERVIDRLPHQWLQGLPGELLVAINVALLPRDRAGPGEADLERWFPSNIYAGSLMTGGLADVWSDFRIHEDGFSRILVRDLNLNERKAGRLVQRLVEIETYRMMALLAFPMAQQYSGQVARADNTLAELTAAMTCSDGQAHEHRLLEQLSRLAAEIERLAAATSYRFGAARAYYALVQRRIQELREERVESKPTLAEFMERRLAPAMRTCESVRERLLGLSERTSRAGNLLRTRVDVALGQQNQQLLASMDRRAQLQLRLQETVEGLSVVVLSYYCVGLVSYALKALKASGAPINAELLTGLSIPVVVGVVWWGVNRLHHALSPEGPH
ncbi:MAG: DUF3422 domain-containing protein [Candidatus Competibacteraceae bacterium]|nr:DUF3422 domain-containing protein [Candidatus Competibacteraceae bacterium]